MKHISAAAVYIVKACTWGSSVHCLTRCHLAISRYADWLCVWKKQLMLGPRRGRKSMYPEYVAFYVKIRIFMPSFGHKSISSWDAISCRVITGWQINIFLQLQVKQNNPRDIRLWKTGRCRTDTREGVLAHRNLSSSKKIYTRRVSATSVQEK